MTCAEFQRVLQEGIEEGWDTQQEFHLNACGACSSLFSELNAISTEARLLRASDEPSPRVWKSISAAIEQLESELELVASEARKLQASDEPSPRVWNFIAAVLQQEQMELQAIASEAHDLQAIEEPNPRVWNSLEIALRQEGLIRQPQRERSLIPFAQRFGWAWMVPVAATVLAIGFYLAKPTVKTTEVASTTAQSTPAPVAAPQPQSAEDQQVLEAVSKRTPAMRDTYESNLRNVNAYIRDAEQSVKSDPNDEQAEQYLMDAYQQKQMVYNMALDRSLP
jgi:hypothetical protein